MIKITKKTGNLLVKVREKSGVDLSVCLQCKKCSSGCPAAGLAAEVPSGIIRRLQMGAGDELLKADLVWLCLSCGTCLARCPMKIDFPAVIDAMRNLALEKGVARPKGAMPRFNREFLRTVRGHGRAYDLSTIVGYKLGTLNLTGDMDKVPAMLIKGKIALLPLAGADKKVVKRIFSNVKENK